MHFFAAMRGTGTPSGRTDSMLSSSEELHEKDAAAF